MGTEYPDLEVCENINALAADIATIAVEKGFWDFPGARNEELIKSTKAMLVITEISELVEGIRATVKPESSIEGFSNEAEEIADAIIRLLDYAGYYEIDIGGAILAKMDKNRKRPHRHGKSF